MGSAGPKRLQTLIRCGGLAQVCEYLGSCPGIGPKTIAIVLQFALQVPDFAVDTHVFRYAKQLGWVPKPQKGLAAVTRESTYAHLNAKVPDDLKFSLHLLLT